MKIVAIEPINMSASQVRYYEDFFRNAGYQFVCFPDRNENSEILKQRLKHADIAIVSNIRLTKEILSSCPKLKLLSVAFTGLDHIDLDYCSDQGIDVINSAGYATTAVVELTIGMIIELYRKISFLDRECKRGGTKGNILGTQMKGKTAGILGTGLIGKEVAIVLKSLGCRVIAFDQYEDEDLKREGIHYYPLNDIFSLSDIISIHLPLTPQTENLITFEKLSLCQPSAIIINTARGKIINSQDLAHALKTKQIAGAAVDVFETEPPLKLNHPLLKIENCITLPHIGFATREAFDNRIEIAMKNIVNWLKYN